MQDVSVDPISLPKIIWLHRGGQDLDGIAFGTRHQVSVRIERERY